MRVAAHPWFFGPMKRIISVLRYYGSYVFTYHLFIIIIYRHHACVSIPQIWALCSCVGTRDVTSRGAVSTLLQANNLQ